MVKIHVLQNTLEILTLLKNLTMIKEYPAKVLLAWAEAIEGNIKIRDWLLKNGYQELAIFTYAIRNLEEPREWLVKNNHPHLMALIEGAEGNIKATEWLKKNGFSALAEVALMGDGNIEAEKWLAKHGHKELIYIGTKINHLKSDIEDRNNDYHFIN